MLNDTLSNLMSKILNSGKAGKTSCIVSPVSKQMIKILEIMKDNTFIGDYKIVRDARAGYVEINLINAINNCKVIKPRFAFKKSTLEKYEKRFLPAKEFGIIIVSTSKGMMTNKESREKGLGGRLIAYVY